MLSSRCRATCLFWLHMKFSASDANIIYRIEKIFPRKTSKRRKRKKEKLSRWFHNRKCLCWKKLQSCTLLQWNCASMYSYHWYSRLSPRRRNAIYGNQSHLTYCLEINLWCEVYCRHLYGCQNDHIYFRCKFAVWFIQVNDLRMIHVEFSITFPATFGAYHTTNKL